MNAFGKDMNDFLLREVISQIIKWNFFLQFVRKIKERKIPLPVTK